MFLSVFDCSVCLAIAVDCECLLMMFACLLVSTLSRVKEWMFHWCDEIFKDVLITAV